MPSCRVMDPLRPRIRVESRRFCLFSSPLRRAKPPAENGSGLAKRRTLTLRGVSVPSVEKSVPVCGAPFGQEHASGFFRKHQVRMHDGRGSRVSATAPLRRRLRDVRRFLPRRPPTPASRRRSPVWRSRE